MLDKTYQIPLAEPKEIFFPYSTPKKKNPNGKKKTF